MPDENDTEVVRRTTCTWTWHDLIADCPLWHVTELDDIADEVADRMNLRRRSNEDETVIDLMAWGRLYRKHGTAIVELSGWSQSRLQHGERIDRYAAKHGGLKAEWLGLGVNGIMDIIRDEEANKPRGGKVNTGSNKPVDIEPATAPKRPDPAPMPPNITDAINAAPPEKARAMTLAAAIVGGFDMPRTLSDVEALLRILQDEAKRLRTNGVAVPVSDDDARVRFEGSNRPGLLVAAPAFKKAMKTLKRTAPLHLAHVLLRLRDGQVEMLSSDHESGTCSIVPLPVIAHRMPATGIPFALTGPVLEDTDAPVVCILDQENGDIEFTAGAERVRASTEDPSKFSFWDETLAASSKTAIVPARRLAKAIKYASNFVHKSNDSTRPEIAHVEVREGVLWATDRETMVRVTIPELENSTVRIGRAGLSRVVKFLESATGDVTILEHERMAFMRADGVTFGVMRPTLAFPNFNLIPPWVVDQDYYFEVNRSALRVAIKRKGDRVRLNLGDAHLDVKQGDIAARIPLVGRGGEFEPKEFTLPSGLALCLSLTDEPVVHVDVRVRTENGVTSGFVMNAEAIGPDTYRTVQAFVRP